MKNGPKRANKFESVWPSLRRWYLTFFNYEVPGIIFATSVKLNVGNLGFVGRDRISTYMEGMRKCLG